MPVAELPYFCIVSVIFGTVLLFCKSSAFIDIVHGFNIIAKITNKIKGIFFIFNISTWDVGQKALIFISIL